ncbi:phosphoadenosine phosphosulfate reductase family protein [Vibrio parahaemolyticus]|uniref:phosphoadenosine phosphosulfate reductase domain-containing protein n=2 Tax=Vibrio parahaemolyticus TaxID=670 RepID=UPI0003A84284|nr:phosphoadenosine phosphosulfate reductase family protein [Vibrio parahaemolyticus]EGQ7791910.1 phosphoadenosine phosphosulfate reductase family protein [Vibrio parahaemolyticus]EGQ7809247.1 phosphoadenosine phosphosulfate reductase family protein [Vibrio parahaemolyticus]MBE4074650.1 phosphoadenosine phosphosulfate reductase family protein [Vibrio parahaemolyticus]MBE4801850.1 phosphoadenosine phosphosulfate reductase family protein [Vibrio parahaemolyticus]MBY7716205.1 phosphoadenosine pho
MAMHRKKEFIEVDVETKAKERIRYLYETFGDVAVSFSGGKDSNALLELVLEVAHELNRVPVRAVFFDEEAIHPPTIEFVHRVAERDDVDLEWYCLEFKHRNACSNDEPFWHCWDKRYEHLWVRDMPVGAITEHSAFKFGDTVPEFCDKLFEYSDTVLVLGIRTQESIRRLRAVLKKKNENYIIRRKRGSMTAYPIYDMSSNDVWRVIANRNADYNKTYDIFNRTRLHDKLLHQRVCPPYGEEPLRGLDLYAECFPELWHKMINRVPGAATAARYGNTELYSRAKKPDNWTYRQYVENVIQTYKGKYREQVVDNLNSMMRYHAKRTADPIPEEDTHPLTGLSYKFLAKAATRGDFKGRVKQMLVDQAEKACKRLGITPEEAQELYGREIDL